MNIGLKIHTKYGGRGQMFRPKHRSIAPVDACTVVPTKSDSDVPFFYGATLIKCYLGDGLVAL